MPYKDPEKAKESARGRNKAWRLRNIEAQREREKSVKKQRRAIFPEEAKNRATEERKSAPEKVRARWRRWKYGLSEEAYDHLLFKQNHACAGCRVVTKLVIDHDHNDGKVRGLLCDPCNRAIGIVKDEPKTLRALADYLEKQ